MTHSILNSKSYTVIEISPTELEKYIKSQYDLKEFTVNSSNMYRSNMYRVENRELTVDEHDLIQIIKKDAGCLPYEIYVILDDLCGKECIPEGVYVIREPWD